jgi:polycystin 1L2
LNILKINSVENLWNWIQNDFSPKIRANPWYNKNIDYDLDGYIGDFTSRMIGYAIMRQVRVKNNSCIVSSRFKNIDSCNSDSLNQMNLETIDYSINWKSFNSSLIPNIEMLNTYKSFQHMSASSLDNYPYMTGLNTYLGDGYVFNLTGSLNELQSNLTLLQKLNWIDRQTRAIFIQFLLFNPNINMFAYLNILFEILPSGNMINSIQIDTIKLFSNSKSTSILLLVYFILICLMLIKEIPIMNKKKWKYLIQFWKLVNLLIISCSIASFAVSFNFYYNQQKYLDLISQSQGYSYINFQALTISNNLLIILLALTCFFSSIKFIRLFRFSKKILFFSKVFKNCLNNMANFSFIFLVFLFAFIQIMYLSYNDQIKDFKSFTTSIMTVFNILITRCPISYLNNNFIIIPFFFILDFIFLSLMILILENTFRSMKKDREFEDKYEIDFIKTLKSKLNILDRKIKLKNTIKEKDSLNELSIKINKFIAYFTEVFFLFSFLINFKPNFWFLEC